MKGHNRSRCCRLPQTDIGDGATAAQNTDPPLAPPCIGDDAVEHVAAVTHFENMSSKRVGSLSGYDDRWFWPVLGTRWSEWVAPILVVVAPPDF